MKSFKIIVATTTNGGIGKNNTIPWKIKEDMDYFKKVTLETTLKEFKNVVIMGKLTFLSIPEKFRPLSGRINIVLSNDEKFKKEEEIKNQSIYFANSLNEAIELVHSLKDIENVFVIGGKTLYNESLKNPLFNYVYQTEIKKDIECDIFINLELLHKNFKCIETTKEKLSLDIPFVFKKWQIK